MSKKIKKACDNCFGNGQVERGSAGPVDCKPCKGTGQIDVARKVDHYEPVKVNIEKKG